MTIQEKQAEALKIIAFGMAELIQEQKNMNKLLATITEAILNSNPNNEWIDNIIKEAIS